MKIKYKKRIVAFVDVLGFKNIIYSSDNNKISEYFTYSSELLKKNSSKGDFDFILISDSIILYGEPNKESFKSIVRTIAFLQAKLLVKGILIRGSISFGDLYVHKSKNIIVGTGLINAYQLELKAIYPRIIIDRKLSKILFTSMSELVSFVTDRYSLPLVKLEVEKRYPIDYPFINFGLFYFTQHSANSIDSLFDFLTTNYYKNIHVDKYEWLKAHLTNSIGSLIEHYEDLTSIKGKNRWKYNLLTRTKERLENL